MVPFYCSSCIAGAIFRSLHHFGDDDSLCPPSPSRSPSLLPLGWIMFSYYLRVLQIFWWDFSTACL